MYARCRLLREVDSWPLLRATLGCRFQRGGESHKTGQLENIQVTRVQKLWAKFPIFLAWGTRMCWSLVLWCARGPFALTFVIMWKYVSSGLVLSGIYVTPNMVTHAQRVLQDMTVGYALKLTWFEVRLSDIGAVHVRCETYRPCWRIMCFKKMWAAHRPHMTHCRGCVPTGPYYGVQRFQIQYLRWGPSEQI